MAEALLFLLSPTNWSSIAPLSKDSIHVAWLQYLALRMIALLNNFLHWLPKRCSHQFEAEEFSRFWNRRIRKTILPLWISDGFYHGSMARLSIPDDRKGQKSYSFWEKFGANLQKRRSHMETAKDQGIGKRMRLAGCRQLSNAVAAAIPSRAKERAFEKRRRTATVCWAPEFGPKR